MKEAERNFLIFLHDIIDNIHRIERFTQGISFDAFRDDEKTYFATIQCIEIIGEAAKHIPQSVRADYPGIPWNDVAGMRDKLIHSYFGTDPGRVWMVVTDDIPVLKPQIEAVIKAYER
jgi:uncharacterized protein with HEPN domain